MELSASVVAHPGSVTGEFWCSVIERKLWLQLPRYYRPLHHPKAPGLSLAGVRLVIADHAKGLPVLRAHPLCTCCRHYPGAAIGDTLRSFPQPYQPSQKGSSGRPAQ